VSDEAVGTRVDVWEKDAVMVPEAAGVAVVDGTLALATAIPAVALQEENKQPVNGADVIANGAASVSKIVPNAGAVVPQLVGLRAMVISHCLA
jgi:hypothetical protein